MWIAQTIDELRTRRAKLRGRVALVPTMGALHEGHLSLVRQAHALADRVLVSIFVNPIQFGSGEDLRQYPRPLEQDLVLCEREKVTGVFHPTADEMYPPQVPASEVNVPAVAGDLEGLARPGHFAGVCRVVLKLFNLCQPRLACFGRKDLQQLRVIQAMTADLNLPIGIVECETMREADGLAMSSRNVRLCGDTRQHALGLSKALREARMLVEEAGETDPVRVETVMKQVLRVHHVAVDYAAIRHPLTLARLDSIAPALTGGVAALVAGRVGVAETGKPVPADGEVRLIDNMLLGV